MGWKWEDSWHKSLWNLAREKLLQDRGALLKEEGDVIREYQAMHEEFFLRSWLRKDGEDKKGRQMEADTKTKEEMGKKRKREEEKEGNETVIAKRRCVYLVSTEAFDNFLSGRGYGEL